MEDWIKWTGLIGGVAMPLFNIPLIYRIYRRKSSQDISLGWLYGIWACILLMLPSTLVSENIIFRVFGVLNTLMFSVVVIVVLIFRSEK